jgi:hypothetical protein
MKAGCNTDTCGGQIEFCVEFTDKDLKKAEVTRTQLDKEFDGDFFYGGWDKSKKVVKRLLSMIRKINAKK